MAFSRGAKYPFEFLYRRLSASHWQTGNSYSSLAHKVLQINSPVTSSNGYSNVLSARQMFLRSFSVESSSEQMNLIKQLRERTSAPIKDVKSALVACNWDIEAAQKDLRKRGVILASKKSSRTAAEGLLALAQNDDKVALIELNCETDFVSRNDIFQYLALTLAKTALSVEGSSTNQGLTVLPLGPENLEELKINLGHPKLSGEISVQNAITQLAAIMGENVKLRRGYTISKSSHGVISSYLHTSPQSGLGRIAGILTLEAEDDNAALDVLQPVGSQLAMHIVAAKPLFLSKELVSSEALMNERDILRTQAETSGKPQMAIEKMVEGRLRKYFEEVVLMEQKFVVNDAVTVKSVISDLSKEVGSTVKIGKFFRMEVGEGIERAEASNTSEGTAQAP